MARNILVLTILILILSLGQPVDAGSRPVTIDDYTFISSGSVGRAIRDMEAGSWDVARLELERILNQNPRNHYALFDLGVWYGRSGNPDRGENYIRKALDLRFSTIYLEGLSQIKGTLGRGSELYPRIFWCNGECNIGNYYARAGLWEDALEHYARSLDYNNRYHKSCFHMALAYEAMGDRENAIEFCEKAISIKHRNTGKYVDFLEYLQTSDVPETVPWDYQEPEYREPAEPEYREPAEPEYREPAEPEYREPDYGEPAEPMDPVEPEYRFVRVDIANLRTSPSTLGRRIQLLHRGSRVVFLKSDESWVYVRTFHQLEGWVHGDLLSITVDGAWEVTGDPEVSSDTMFNEPDSQSEPSHPAGTEIRTVIHQETDAAVRAEPSILAEIIYYFHSGDTVTVLNQSRSNWVFVRTPVGAGYMPTSSFIQE